jgi:hypothetical protein
MIGFKICLALGHPFAAPYAYLDEAENKNLYEYIDYLQPINRITFAYLDDWKTHYNAKPQEFNLQHLLIKINTLFSHAPPIDMY